MELHPTSTSRIPDFARISQEIMGRFYDLPPVGKIGPMSGSGQTLPSPFRRGDRLLFSANRTGSRTMRHYRRIAALFLLVPWMSACSPSSPSQLETIALQLSDAANRCLGDVRDNGAKYENSQHCRVLIRTARQYVDAGGFKDGAPARADRLAESARARAWMALAISKTGDRNLSIW